MATNGQRGAGHEYACRKRLEEAGFVVLRSAASKTAVDLAALGSVQTPRAVPVPGHALTEGEVWLVQCKSDGVRHMSPAIWDALVDLAWDCGGVPVLATREKVGTRLGPVFYALTGYRTPRSRSWPMRRIEMPDA